MQWLAYSGLPIGEGRMAAWPFVLVWQLPLGAALYSLRGWLNSPSRDPRIAP